MQLPTDNKSYAIIKVWKLMLPLTILLGFLVLYYSNSNLLYICITIFLISAFISFLFIRSQSISKVIMLENHLEVYHLDKIMKVPIDNIIDIVSGLNSYISYQGKMSMMYRLDLNNKYHFGSKLYFKYEEHLDQDVDPSEISILKEKINTLANSKHYRKPYYIFISLI